MSWEFRKVRKDGSDFCAASLERPYEMKRELLDLLLFTTVCSIMLEKGGKYG
jgi:hypothetical protein